MKNELPTAILAGLTLLALACTGPKDETSETAEPNLITFSRIDKAWDLSKGANTTVAILDWQFDLRGEEATKYLNPISLVPGEEIGELKPWHGEWMAEIVHRIAPEAKIIPIKARGLQTEDYQDYLIEGIRLAADQGAVAVTNSMGPVNISEALDSAIEYAEQRGTVFVDVHPEHFVEEDKKRRPCTTDECNDKIIHSGVVSVPDHPASPESNRDIYVWPYDLDAKYEDGWGYSNGPPNVAGVIALMRSANPDLTPGDVRRIIVDTAFTRDGFEVLDAEAAVRAALEER